MSTRVLSAMTIVVLLAALFSGCSDDSSELQRVVCEVQAVNAGAPLISAYVVDGGDGVIGGPDPDDLYTIDAVMVNFRARPYSRAVMTIPTDGTYSSYIITGYNLTWSPGPNAPAGLDLTPYNVSNAPLYVQVPIMDEAVSSVLVVDRSLKEAVATVLGLPWNFDQDFSAIARLQFIGHDSGSSHESVIETGLYVNFTFALSSD